MKVTDNKQEKALKLFAMHYNCAQSVLTAFAEDYAMNEAQALLLSSCFGGGMRMGATCGALTGALMVLGLAKGFTQPSPENKAAMEEICSLFIADWRKQVGSTDCREILPFDVSDPILRIKAKEDGIYDHYCPNCISTSINLLDDYLKR